MLKRGKGSVSDWLVTHCNISLSRAEELEERLSKECFIESVGSLRQCALLTPDVLDKLNLPITFLLSLNDQLGILNCKSLNDVTVSEVSSALVNIFPETPECAAVFFKARVTGFVLSQITTCRELMDWGIQSKKDALTLLGHISTWKVSGVPKHYLRVVDKPVAKESLPMLSPRKRQKGEDGAPFHRSTSSASGGTAQPLSFSVTAQIALLSSADEKTRSQVLEKLLKGAEKDRSIVDMFVHTGLIDKLLAVQNDPAEDVVYRVLNLLNTTIQKGDAGTLQYLIVEKKLMSTLGSKVWSISHRVRMMIVRIAHSIALTPLAETLLQPSTIQGLVCVYFTSVTGVTARDAEETRHRTALALQALCRRVTTYCKEHIAALLQCVPVVRDVLEIDHNHRVTFPAACCVLSHIMRFSVGRIAAKTSNSASQGENGFSSSSSSNPSRIVEKSVPEEIITSVLPKLLVRVSDTKSEIAESALSVLVVFCECCRDDQLSALQPALTALPKLLQTSAVVQVRLAAAKFVQAMCEHGGESAVSMLIAADTVTPLLDTVLSPRLAETPAFEEADDEEGEVREAAARSFLAAVLSSNDTQLGYFLRINVYSALLNMIYVFSKAPSGGAAEEVLLQVITLLRDLVLRVKGIDEEEDLTAEQEQREIDAWVALQKMASGSLALPHARRPRAADGVKTEEEEAGTVRGEADRGADVGVRLREAAGALIRSACALGILEANKPA